MSMGFMVAMAGRKRDERGRYMDGDNDRRMDGNYSRMEDEPEMRRRRDSRGRYMGGGTRMAYDGGNTAHYWPEPHIPPYLDAPESRRRDDRRMEQQPYHMRDRNVVNIRDYQDRRHIGFEQARMDDDEGEGDMMRQYGRRYDPNRPKMHHGGEYQSERQMGHAESSGAGHLSREEAEEWVEGMQGADGSKGGRWKLQEIKQYAGNFGIQGEEKINEFFAVMNAMYTDYCKVAKKHGVDKVDFYADLAKAFMDDRDAMPGKVKTYYECIAKKDDD